MKSITIVIPALNEELGIGPVLAEIPIAELKNLGYSVEVLVIDNGSSDNTVHIAKLHNATVIIQPIRGYGNAYKAGFANATGDLIATGDADLTYPFSSLPTIIEKIENENIDFINTDRISTLSTGVMSISHQIGNRIFTYILKALFGLPFNDTQSGMWIFKRSIWNKLDVHSSGMAFSQELKIEVFLKGFVCAEIPIQYRTRAGEEKLNTIRDGINNMYQLLVKRLISIV